MGPPVPEGRSGSRGRFTKPAAFASAKGQARSFRLAAASSAALPSASAPARRPKAKDPNFRLGCGWEGFPPLPEDRLGHIRKLSRKMSRSKHNPPVDNEDNVHNFPAVAAIPLRKARATRRLPRARRARIKEAPILDLEVRMAAWTVASTRLRDGCSARASCCSAPPSSPTSSSRPSGRDPMGYPIKGVQEEGGERGRRRSADRPLSADRRRGARRSDVPQMPGLPQCRSGRRQRPRPEPVGHGRQQIATGPRFLLSPKRCAAMAAAGTGIR